MQISDVTSGLPDPGAEQCRFPKLEECAHFHYEKVHLPSLEVSLHSNVDKSLHSHNSTEQQEDDEYFTLQVTSGDECWLLQRSIENFRLFDAQLHQCIYDRKVSHLPDLSESAVLKNDVDDVLDSYLREFCSIANNSLNCGPVLNWLQMDNKGHRLLVPSEESRSINTPAVAAAYSIRRYVSQARDELDLEVGDMISVIDMASPGESVWWRGKRGFKVGFFPQHCVHIIGEKVPRNMPLPPPVVGSLVVSPMKPVLRKHGKLIAFFRSFILNRPSRRRLKQSGILRERVFGCDLGEHLSNSGNSVPMVLRCCAEFIEKNGIVDGIYRLSGVTSNIQKLRNAFDEDRVPNLYTEEILQDIHSVASLLKMYFRELPNPLCTYQLYQSFVNAVQGCNPAVRNSDSDHERLLKMREAVQKLPPPHYRTLEYLMRHLARVAKHGPRTGMTTRNVAIVWAPNLLRSEELEGGGVAALQGVGVQAVVTEFLICYADLIFCDRLPAVAADDGRQRASNGGSGASSPRRGRPKSLAISTPTKLITLEEARTKHQLGRAEECCGYIEVGGGPKNLPERYHTVIELPSAASASSAASGRNRRRKRHSSGWRSFFSKSRNSSQNALSKSRKASTPGVISAEKNITDTTLLEAKRKLRSVKSAESLTSGISESAANNEIDSLGPLQTLQKAPGHNRSVSHDSYFDLLQQQTSQNNSEGSLLDLSEIQLNFDLEESEMRIFSEDESLVSSPRIQKDPAYRRYLSRARPDDYPAGGGAAVVGSANPSPKKQARVVVSPESMSRKRTRLEDQLSDIQYIDCGTPENAPPCTISTTAVVHPAPEVQTDLVGFDGSELYRPKSKSPRSLHVETERQSLNLDKRRPGGGLPRSLTDGDIGEKLGRPLIMTPTPQSPVYKPLSESNASTPIDFDPAELFYQQLKANFEDNVYENFSPTIITKSKSPTYENVLTTISITYKSPTKRFSTTPPSSVRNNDVSPAQSSASTPIGNDDVSIYEDVSADVEAAPVPAEPLAVLPTQGANQPPVDLEPTKAYGVVAGGNEQQRPRSLSALEDLRGKESQMRSNLSTSAVCNSRSETRTLSSNNGTLCKSSETTLDSSVSSEFVHNMTNSSVSLNGGGTNNQVYRQFAGDAQELSPTDLSLSEVVHSSSENLSNNQFSCPITPTQNSLSPNVSPTQNDSQENVLKEENNFSESENRIDKRKSSETLDENVIYQQVKYFRRSVHEINALLEISDQKNAKNDSSDENQLLDDDDDSNSHIYENVLNEDDDEASMEIKESKVAEDVLDKVNVKSLTKNFETKSSESTKLSEKPPMFPVDKHRKLSEEKPRRESNPPCVRLRNLKHTIKTRSLDENEFNKEVFEGDENSSVPRRKSLDEENLSYSVGPKSSELSKMAPARDKSDLTRLSHPIESKIDLSDQKLNRERIEKYKEERRKVLHEKYRSESFKEDKDVLMSRLKLRSRDDVYRKRTESEKSRISEENEEPAEADNKFRIPDDKFRILPDDRTKISEDKFKSSEDKSRVSDDKFRLHDDKFKASDDKARLSDGLKSLTAKFESQVLDSPQRRTFDGKLGHFDDNPTNDDLVRNRRKNGDDVRGSRRRHTFDSRERELELDQNWRSAEIKSPRKEKASPSLCIKDMKAIFESKSQQ